MTLPILHMSQPLDFDNDVYISRVCLPEKNKSALSSINYPELEQV